MSKESRRANRAAARTDRTRATSSGPSGSPRAGRRERPRYIERRSFVERYRNLLVGGVIVAVVAVLAGLIFLQATQAAYTCGTIWTPAPTPSTGPSATPNLGYVQPDMGRQHVPPGDKVTYTYCAPASGSHYAQPAAPITARLYGPGDNVLPEGWVHNLEHGAMVILYTGTSTGATTEGQAQLRALFEKFPPGPICGTPKGQIGPVIARFDDMSTPFQAIVWGRVLPLATYDEPAILAFWSQWGERTNPENQCPDKNRNPTTSAAPSGSVAPSAAPPASPAPSTSPAPSASVAPSPS